ncbi:hypothetical protein SERLA73DRAFT_144601 [Serpula lacrymans var. lacrymans S7.3]|uniref:Uncharacterized protein n=1 Tax=Serpula lacrymans var. lacrymans (strain S7.3) TaxID=936435 RepID=F8QC25_SERL3|nr:hypothetical protein SERLA73DRAFT_144601 [Serpula lacrymans var. lacrymans S7.3]
MSHPGGSASQTPLKRTRMSLSMSISSSNMMATSSSLVFAWSVNFLMAETWEYQQATFGAERTICG